MVPRTPRTRTFSAPILHFGPAVSVTPFPRTEQLFTSHRFRPDVVLSFHEPPFNTLRFALKDYHSLDPVLINP